MPGLHGDQHAAADAVHGRSDLRASGPRSPAYQAGLRRPATGSSSIDGRKIELAAQVKQELSRRYAGDKIRVAVLRDGKRIEREVRTGRQAGALRAALPRHLARCGRRPATRPRRQAVFASATSSLTVQPPRRGSSRAIRSFPSAGRKWKRRRPARSRLAELQPDERVPVEFRCGRRRRRVELTLARLPEGLPGPLPPAREPGKPAEGKRPQVGPIHLKVPDVAGETWSYVPENYNPAVPHGIVFGFPPPAKSSRKRSWPIGRPIATATG